MRPLILGLLTLGLLLGTPLLLQAAKPKKHHAQATGVSPEQTESVLLLIRRLHGRVELSADDGDNDRDDHTGGRPVITSISLSGTAVTDSELDFILRRTPALEHLDLSHTAIDDTGMASIHDLPNLGTLDLSNTLISGGVTFNLGGVLPELVSLNVNNTKTGVQNVNDPFEPQKLPHLEELFAAGTGIADGMVGGRGGVHALQQGFPLLRILDISNCKNITDKALPFTGQMQQLQVLSVAGDKITDVGLAGLAPAPMLETLNLAGTQIDGTGLAGLAGLPQLHNLVLNGTPITDVGLANVRSLPALEVLWLTGTAIDDQGLASVAGLPLLHELNLGGTRVTDAGVAQLRTLRLLRNLSLFNTQVGDGGVRELRHLRRLRTLDLSGTLVTDKGLQSLPRLPELESLNLQGTRVSDRGLPFLVETPELVFVDLLGTRVSRRGVAILRLEDPKLKVVF
jgi:Leucine-rich repeat (LRR) protein